MYSSNNLLAGLLNISSLIGVLIGVATTYAVSRVYRGTKAKESSLIAQSTVNMLTVQVNTLKDQMNTQKESFERHTASQDKMIDDLRDRNNKLEEQVKVLSTIPWKKSEENFQIIMSSLKTISDNQLKMTNYFADHPSSQVFVNTKETQ